MSAFEITAGLASILGLLFSFGALIQAKRATTAAKQARDQIAFRTLADEFEIASVKTDQLTDYIQHDRFPEAVLRANELAGQLSEMPYRRSPYLKEDQKNAVLNARTQMQITSQVISSNRNPNLTPKQKQALMDACHRISASIREILGTIKGEMDSGAKQ